MSYELAIINPRTGSKKRRRRATAKQLAARRRFIAKFAKGRKAKRSHAKRRKKSSIYSGVSVMAKRRRRRSRARNAKGHFTKGHKRAKSTARRTRRRRSTSSRRPAVGYTIGSGKIRRRKLNPRVRRRRYRRNPMGLGSFSVRGILGQLAPAAYGAGGAVALNLALSYLPLPEALKTGWPKNLTRLAGAMVVGFAAKKFLGSRGAAVGLGAMTVVVYDIVKGLIASAAPDIGARLGEFEDVTLLDDGFIDPASPVRGFGAYLEGEVDDGTGVDGVGAYLQGDLDGNLDGVGEFHYA